MSAIYRRELRSYFNGFMGWLFIALITAVFGVSVLTRNFIGLYPYIEDNFSSPLMIIAAILGKYFALVTVLAITFALMLPYPFILNLYTTATSSVSVYIAFCSCIVSINWVMNTR